MLHIILPTCVQDPDMLARMLASLHEHTQPCHLVVVVNAREDHRRAAVAPMLNCLRDNGWKVRDLYEGERIGFVEACNWGWRSLRAGPEDLVAVLNDDLVFKGRWVEPLAQQIGRGAKLVGPSLKHVGPDGTWGPENCPPYIEGWCLMMLVADNHGAHPFNTVNAWDELAPWLFDPQFEPQLCEDMDLGLRIGAAFGPQRVQQVEIPVEHVRSVTVGQGPAREPYWTENRRKLMAKWNLGGQLPATPSPPHAVTPSPPHPPTPSSSLQERAAEQGWEVVS